MDEIITFDKKKLDLVFRNKVIEIEEKKQKEAAMIAGPRGKVSEKNREKANRKLMETIISSLINDKDKIDKEPDVYEAYQIILAEHYKTKMKQTTKGQKEDALLRRKSSSRKSKKRMSLSTLNIDEVPKITRGTKKEEQMKNSIKEGDETQGKQRHELSFDYKI